MDGANELTGFLRNRAGEHLRGVVRYPGDLYDIICLRDDIEERRMEEG